MADKKIISLCVPTPRAKPPCHFYPSPHALMRPTPPPRSKEVAEHNTTASCWIVVEGKVFDATSYLQPHPGGKEIIMSVAGACACGPVFPSPRRARGFEGNSPPPAEQQLTARPAPPPCAGKDATSSFNDTGHSSAAKKDLAKLQIGVLSSEEASELAKQAEVASAGGVGLLGYVLAAVALAAALAYQFMPRK